MVVTVQKIREIPQDITSVTSVPITQLSQPVVAIGLELTLMYMSGASAECSSMC